MSLFLIEEICTDCFYATWYETSSGRTILDACDKDVTGETDAIRGSCDYFRQKED